MAVVETKEIGISLNCSDGNYVNTEFLNGSLMLKKKKGSEILYEKEGYWESCVLDIEGQFKDYDKLAVTKTQFTKDLYKIETRTSNDGNVFNEYIALSVGGSILSPKKRYIQVKITFYVGYVDEVFEIAKFNNTNEKNNWDGSEFVDTSAGLKLANIINFSMAMDNTWSDTGTLLRQRIKSSEFKQINNLSIE